MRKVAIATLGCKVNSYDSQAVLALFMKADYAVVNFQDEADVYVVNTCCVTNLADKKSRQMIGRAKSKSPEAIVVAMGCASQAEPKKYADLGVDIIIGTAERFKIIQLVDEFESKQVVAVKSDVL